MTKPLRASPLRPAYGALRLPRGGLASLVLSALLLASGGAHADARSEASRHYRLGLDLLANGQTERAIEEFKAAYAIKPHPDPLYNIARAYLDLGNLPEALNYFRRYVATDPEDRAQTEVIMARLAAALAPREPKPEEKKEPAPAEEKAEATPAAPGTI